MSGHWATILDIIEAGIEGDKEKCRAYAELWLHQLQKEDDDETRMSVHLERILEGRKGIIVKSQNNRKENR